ncbi:MAG TPA: hypothetical protein VMM35_09170 [Longimicrobiales bacterium]|nr:hypothetical protein [Longimicrobiales bacterium]
MQADGKVITAMYTGKKGDTTVDSETGEIRSVRFDPDMKKHTVGGGHKVRGVKFTIVSARTEHLRVILDHEHVPFSGEGGEAGVSMRCLRRLSPLIPGAQGVNYDMAMKGVHINTAMRDMGWLILTKVAKDRNDTYEAWNIEDQEVETTEGSKTAVHVFALKGRPGLRELNDRGEEIFVPLERLKTERRGGTGGFRFYGEYALPPEYRAVKPLRLRLHGNEDDARRDLNRTEHLRAIPPGDMDFRKLNRRRNDAESINRALEDTFYWGRAHSVGRVAQDADLLGFGLGMNALSWHRHRKRAGLPAAA